LEKLSLLSHKLRT